MFRTSFRSANSSVVTLGALSMAAVLVLSGCSGSGDEPGAEAATGGSGSSTSSSASASGTASASASATPTPTPTQPAAAYKPASAEGPAENVPLPVMPELAKQESQEGLQAFAEYWYALANYGYETGDTAPIRKISGEDCVSCNSYLKVVESGYAGDDWMLGSKVTMQDVSANFVATDQGYYQATVLFLQEDLHYYAPDGFLGTQPGSHTPVVQLMEAAYTPKGWFAVHIETLEM